MVGIVLEQHPDRARLFMQWKQMDWPVLVDALNILELRAVPVTILIDEAGIVRSTDPRASDLEVFLSSDLPDRGRPASVAIPPDIQDLKHRSENGDAEVLRAAADSLFLWGTGIDLDTAIDNYHRAINMEPGNGTTHFHLGVTYRKRHESDRRREGDFAQAVEHWSRALEIDPNQYIWRRRIQQFGPRQDKPYPFYDWVETARTEIAARGEMPHSLPVEPVGAEIAHPAGTLDSGSTTCTEPDPESRIERDPGKLIRIEIVTIPSTDPKSASARIHLIMTPITEAGGHWNNEVGPTEVWIHPPSGWEVDRSLLTAPGVKEPVSDETRLVEFEIGPKAGHDRTDITIQGYALYYVCESSSGVCLFRRQDIAITMIYPENSVRSR